MLDTIPSMSLKQLGLETPDFGILKLPYFYAHIDPMVRSPHRLQFNQLLLITKGWGSHRIDANDYECRPGSLVFTAQGQVQQCQVTSETEGYLVLFTEQYLYRHSQDLKWFFDLHLLNNRITPTVFQMQPQELAELSYLIEQMQREEACHSDFGREAIQHNLLKVLLFKAERLKRMQAKPACADNSQAQLLTRFHQLLEDHYRSNRRVYDYARMLCVTPKRLNLMASQCLGKTAKQAIDERVVLEIQRQLRYSDATSQEIAFSLGFSEVSNMGKFFKRYTGQTPAQFKAIS